VREARAAALAAEEGPDRESWKAKLLDLGLYVASTLICMGDYVTALDHLHRLYKDTITRNVEFAGRVKPVLALVYLQVGDTFSAREWLGGTDTAALEQAVCSIADADFAAATTLLEALQPGDEESSDSVSFRIPVVNNLAITQLHQGDLSRAIELLESLAKNPHDHRLILTVISNLFFLYDLRYDDVKTKRYQVAEMLKSNGIGALASYTAFDR
jgi:tetratricopeptide (TPR) repeat protein